MIILYTGIVLLFYSLLSRKRYKTYIGFLFVLLIMAFQNNVAGDYDLYMESFNEGLESRIEEDEPLWSVLFTIFRPLGWYVFVFCLSLFQCFVLTRLVRKYTVGNYQWLAAVLFFFTFGMMLIQMKAMRQGLAVEMSALPFIFDLDKKRRKWLWCLLPIVAAYFIHNSAIIVAFPLLLYYVNSLTGWLDHNKFSKRGEWFWPVVIVVIFYVIYVLKSSLYADFFTEVSVFFTAYDIRLSSYLIDDQLEGTFNVSWLIVFYDAVIVFLATWYYRHTKGTLRVLTLMTILSCFFDMIFFGMGSLPRIGYYFVIANIAVLCNITELIKNRFGRIFAWVFIVFCMY